MFFPSKGQIMYEIEIIEQQINNNINTMKQRSKTMAIFLMEIRA